MSYTPTTTALTTPRFDASSYTSRKMMRENSEIAIGMNSTSRNAVAHLMRSVSTARTRPMPVKAARATTT